MYPEQSKAAYISSEPRKLLSTPRLTNCYTKPKLDEQEESLTEVAIQFTPKTAD